MRSLYRNSDSVQENVWMLARYTSGECKGSATATDLGKWVGLTSYLTATLPTSATLRLHVNTHDVVAAIKNTR